MTGVQGKIASGLRGSGDAFSDQFGKEISGKSAAIIGALAGVAQVATQKAMSLIASSIGDAVRRVDTLKSAQKTFEYMGFKAQDAAAATKAVTDSILGLPTPLDSAIRGMTSLAATYGDVKLGQKVFSALNDAILGFGGSADMVDNAIMQLSQLPLDGPLDAQTWMSLRNSGLTPVLVAMGKDMGKSVSQLKEDFGSGKLTVQDFVNELTKLDTQGGGGLVSLQKIAKNATSGIATGVANMQTAVSRGIAKIIESIGQKNISSTITAIGSAFEVALKGIASFFNFLDSKGALLPVLGAAIAVVVASLVAVSAPLVAAFAGAVAAAAPFIAIAAAIGAVGVLIAENWKTISTIFRMLIDTFTGGDPTLKAGEERFAGLAKVLSEVAYVIRPFVNFIATQLKSAFQSIVSLGKQAGESLKPLIEGFKQLMANKTVQTVLKAIGIALLALAAAPIVAFIATVIVSITVLSKVLGFLADHFTVVKVLVGVIFAPLIASVALAIGAVKLIIATVKVLIDVFGAIKNAITTAFNAIASVWNSVLAPVFNTIISIVQTILSIYMKVWAAIALVVVGTMFIIGGIIANVMQTIWGVISSIWNAVYGVISSVIGTITGVLVNAWNFYYGLISGVLGAIWGVVSSIWNTIYGFLSSIFGTIGGLVAGAWNAIYGTISRIVGSIWGAVTGTFNNVVNFVAGIGGRILGAMGNFGGLLYNKGRDLIQGLIDGAGSLLSKIGQFFLNKLPGWIQGPFKKALGIASPSKVFAGFGANITEGLASGVNGGQGMVKNAVSNMTDSALAGVTNPLLNPSAFSGGAGVIAGGNGNSSTTNQDVQIGQIVLGDQSAVKEFFKQLNQDTINVGMGLTPNQGA